MAKLKNSTVYTIASPSLTFDKSIREDTFIYVVSTGIMYYIKVPIKIGTTVTTMLTHSTWFTALNV
jgi:hypothetical protein